MRKPLSITLSITLHLLIGVGIGLNLTWHRAPPLLGEKTTVLSSYLTQPEIMTLPSQRESLKPVTLDKRTPIAALKSVTLHQKPVTRPPAVKSLSATKPLFQKAITGGKGEPIPALLTLLHAAIQKEQHYPESALAMEREGNTTLEFKLFPDGHIDQLKIIKSSGTASLDGAALAAINKATPFTGIKKYMNEPGDYAITVEFELT